MGKREMREWQKHLKRIKKAVLKPVPFEGRKYERTERWDPVAIPQRVADVRSRCPVRHLGDLLLALGIPWRTAKDWGTGTKKRRVRSWRRKAGQTSGTEFYERPAKAPHREWLAACKGIPIPKNHDLHFLRYLTRPTLKKFQRRFDDLGHELSGGHGIGENDFEMQGRALHMAADEVVGAVYVRAIQRRSERRKQKFGFDPVRLALVWSEKTHGAPQRTVVEAVTGAVAVDWTELAEQKRNERARLSPAERKRTFVPPTSRRPGARKVERARLRAWAQKRIEERAKQMTDEAFVRVLGYIPREKSL